ncbi:MAG: hypothetical protein HC880_19625 [Bacteroidia bacterium]|nr:hypothetical protein [Bacteroidia bacterium]
MKKAWLVLVFLGLVAPLPAQIPSGVHSADDLGRVFYKALTSREFGMIQYLLAPPTLYPAISPEETGRRHPDELRQLAEVVHQRQEANFQRIIRSADLRDLNLSQFQYQQTDIQALPGPQSLLYGLGVQLTYQSKNYFLTLIAARHKGRWYLLEISLPEFGVVFGTED